uniref:C2H2-type domain-containing protein n=1 Tax=Stegastes partitus TaxID=144197 RepID=A0A3B5BEC4_9TELE
MTLTFYYRHQRTAHSDETPAKSFLHQVCQLQKKAFECKSCGLKFSRASALHSHELQHTDAYKETEEAGQMRSSLLSQDRMLESDQDVRDDEVSLESLLVSKPEMDLKIVEVDFEQADEQCALIASEAENATAEERFDCPECYRWFTSPSSLRVHRMWHGVHRRRQQQNQGQSVAAYTDILDEAEGLEGKNLTCKECGKFFSRLSALVSHQLHHPKRKPFRCPECMMSYSHAAKYNPKKTLLGPKIYHCEQCGKGFWSLGAYSHHKQSQTDCCLGPQS